MSVNLKAWIIQLTAFALLLLDILLRSGWLFLAGMGLIIVAMFWPRCPQCKLPAFWRRPKGSADYFLNYIGNYPGFPSKDCSRCGEDLTL